MSPPTRLNDIARPVVLCSETDTLQAVLEQLSAGNPAALKRQGRWYIVAPRAAAGYPASRRLMDLPLEEAALLAPESTCAEALQAIRDLDSKYFLLEKQGQIQGMASLTDVLAAVVDEVSRAGEVEQALEDSLNFGKILVWQTRLPARHLEMREILRRARYWGPLEAITGYPPQDLPQRWSDIIHPDDLPHLERQAQALLQPGGRIEHTLRFRHRDGYWIWLHARVSSFADPEEQGLLLRGITTDVTHIMALQERIRESETLYRMLSEEALIGVYLTTAERVLYVNPQCAEIFGYEPREIVEKLSPLDLVHPEDRPLVEENLRRRLQGEVDSLSYASRGLRKDGTELHVEVLGHRIEYRGEPAILGTLKDVTQEVEQRRERALFAAVHEALSRRSPGVALQKAMETLGDFLQVDASELLVIDAENEWEVELQWVRPKARASFSAMIDELYGGQPVRQPPAGAEHYAQWMLSSGEALYVPDTAQATFWGDRVRARHGWKTTYALPLLQTGSHQILLFVYARQADALSPGDRTLLEGLMPAFTAAVQAWHYERELEKLNASLEEKVQQRTYELQVLYQLTQQIGYTLDYDELMRLMLEHLDKAVSYDVAASLLLGDGSAELFIRPARPVTPRLIDEIRERMARTLSRMSAQDVSQLLIHEHLLQTSTYASDMQPLDALGSSFQVPLIAGTMTIGMLFVGSQRADDFSADQVRLLNTLAAEASLSIQRLRALLAAEHERLEHLVADMPMGVLLIDHEGYILVANATARRIMMDLEADPGHGVLHRLGSLSLSEILSRADDPLPVEITLEGPPRRVFAVRARPLMRGQANQWILTLSDVTVERETQDRLQAQERLATVGQLAAGIAHDFNNIIGAIILYTELLMAEPGLSQRMQQRLEAIKDQSQQAASLTQQVLDFGRKSVIDLVPMDLSDLLQDFVGLLKRVLPENIRLHVDQGAEEQIIRGDPGRLKQALMNLAINARDAMPDGGELHFRVDRLHVRQGELPPFRDMSPGEWIRLRVSDTGSGIQPDVLPHIFEPFFTTKKPGQGTGLGLAQVYGIIKQHRGYINATSRPGEGSTFVIYLPALDLKEVPGVLLEAREVPHGKGETILVVEDHEEHRRAVSEMLAGLNYRVLEASNGLEALKLLESLAAVPDLVLTDLVMPEMDGRALLETLQEQHPDLRVIIMTGYPLGQGADDQGLQNTPWIQKPVSSDTLAMVIHNTLQRR